MDLRKSVRKSLLLLARITLPAFGFCFICLGAFLLSVRGAGATGQGASHTARAVSAYVCLVVGFLLLTTGVSWTLFLRMKSKMYLQRQGPRPNRRAVHIHTIDRPDFYPPSYEQSLERTGFTVPDAIWVSGNEPHYNIAPPLYTASVSEAPSEDYSGEEPPSYKEAILRVQSVAIACPRSPVAAPPSTPLDTHRPHGDQGPHV
ncbi:hypothetical protein AAFF_G00066290 [Aldrovandia affinis]|uniref:Uncharacterized protein n=1 Tax=Aldrovandia affinis TaxID=143900 RepID=A0AAD7T452_9TELE|nr:hypothetical protein AAFF_G00066290 [Aldrovandia affinis]